MVPRADTHAGGQVFCNRINQRRLVSLHRIGEYQCGKDFRHGPDLKNSVAVERPRIARISMTVRYHSFVGRSDDLNDDADIIFILSDAIDQDLPDCIVGW